MSGIWRKGKKRHLGHVFHLCGVVRVHYLSRGVGGGGDGGGGGHGNMCGEHAPCTAEQSGAGPQRNAEVH